MRPGRANGSAAARFATGAACCALVVAAAAAAPQAGSVSPPAVGMAVPRVAGHGLAGRSAPLNPIQGAARPIRPNAINALGALPAGYAVRDVVVANTNPSLASTDTYADWEPSLAVNPANPDQIAAYTFSSSWPSDAALWYSTDGGATWTKDYTIPQPTGVTAGIGCPCDVTEEYDRSSRLALTALNEAATNDVYTGETSDPAAAASFSWYAPGGTAQQTDGNVNGGADSADQPWVRIARDPVTASQDDTYVGYDDFTTHRLRVAVSLGSVPPDFTRDTSPGAFACCANPGLRLAPDPSTGAMYALWQYETGVNTDGSIAVLYSLNRSTDAGQTWTLDGSSSGTVVASANSNQPTPKFGGVNALLGGVDALAVDPTNSDVYVVYGTKDATTGDNRLAIRRLTPDGSGGLTIGSETFVTGQVQAALPSVAVASNGTIGVLYDTFDGLDGSGYPVFSVHLAQSNDQTAAFSDVTLVTFTSPVLPVNDARQRILGDYQQLRAVGTTFEGMFCANGAAFGRTLSNIDPVFVSAPALVARPGAPTGVAASAGSGEATVTFAPPSSAGGAPITSYTVTASPGGQTATVTGSPAFVEGLANGTSYTFTVAATNAGGTGPSSSPSSPVVPTASDGESRPLPAPPAPTPRPTVPALPVPAGSRRPPPGQ